ncbi:CHAT domain-containing protein [Anabaena subtropica]|uniref:Tetratricopeptide repeat protein n=1 Tax=Anabaena subtropica FACHB-260 TaxID=2692884 RepID=A0ABR8CQB2_9NOST|nr:tetratricopeptide repeat protein [Anabaena subtropica]MBD2345392.1 tetratricopeptide repeat protein [Anabaena subtropica FACHB-260]
MLTRLFQWLKTFDKHSVDDQQTDYFKGVREQVAEEPPELTNADLELLFTQLLQGVNHGRGQQWAIKYLQRMEDRISVERWIDWLLVFGEKLLMSPAPNHHLGRQMVQLGELGIGKVGELSYDIGIRLLNREFIGIDDLDEELEASSTKVAEPSENIPDSPGQELIRSLGDLLWESEEPGTTPLRATSEFSPVDEDTIENLQELSWEYQIAPTESVYEDTIENLQELSWEYQTAPTESVYEDTTENLQELSWEYQTVPTESVDEDTTENLQELSWEYQTAPTEPVDEDTTENLQELSWEYQEAEFATTAPALLMPAQEDVISNLSELVLDYREQNSAAIVSTQSNWDQSLVNLDPNVAYTLDELMVRLDQSANLVHQLAANLIVQTNQQPVITSERSNAFIQAQALFYQGLQQAKSGDLSGAIATYEQAIQLNPNSYEYWFNRGLTLFHLERFVEAIASYDQAIELKPDYYKAWYNRGGTLGQLGLYEEAIASFKQAIAVQADTPEAWSSKAWAELKLGQIGDAIASYDEALVLSPEDQENWYYRGIALGVDEQYEAAVASYDKALEIQPDFHEVWIDRGVVLFNLKQWSEAIASWDKALSIRADFYLAWYNRGVALENSGRREEALASYKQAIGIKPDFHLAWYNQAVALFYLERFLEAIVCYDHALQIKLDYWEAWIGRGTAIGNLNDTETPLNLLTAIAANNSALKQAGYEGKLASYQEGLKHIRPDTHPEGWGRLHLAIANSYYEQGKQYSTSRNYWRKAVTEYNQALLTLTSAGFPQLHLEVLQSLIKSLLGLGQTAQAQELQQRGSNLLQQLLGEPTRTTEIKKQLALKFAGFGQLAVDISVEYGDLVEAWEIAEQGKNAGCTWLLFGWNADIPFLNYRSVQKLLNPHTAIIYWHISPVALHTFIIKDQAPSPILVFTPVQDVETINATPLQDLPLPEASRRLIAFENWLEDWQQTYQDYRQQAQDQQSKSNHPWRVEMEDKLLQLRNILEIETIQPELEGITQLILVPHRDLFKLPLHALFQISASTEEIPGVNITYLPNIQAGLSARNPNIGQFANQTLLSVEYPDSKAYPMLRFANLEAEVVSQMFKNKHRLQGTEATKNNFEDALFDNYNVFHFAGQAINSCTEPKTSELALAGEDKFTLEEISETNLSTYNLVTISACETINNTNQITSSEYVDLVSAFFHRGVSHVVSTLWTVESSASALVIIEFYRRLQEKPANIALAEATVWLRELTAIELTKWYEDLLNNLDPEELKLRAYLATHLYRISKMPADKNLYSHPYYWAAFIITGKP